MKTNSKPSDCEIFILAGGLSTRMGRDKSRVRIGSRTMLEQVRGEAARTGLRVRVIRRDAVARCGPLGGIYTGLKRSRAEMVLFLACDMPFVTVGLLKSMVKNLCIAGRSTPPPHPSPMPSQGRHESVSPKETNASRYVVPRWGRGRGREAESSRPYISVAVFASEGNRAGFPLVLHRESALPIVSGQIAAAEYSLQSLAKKLRAKTIRPPRSAAHQLANINTPAELQQAAQRVRGKKNIER